MAEPDGVGFLIAMIRRRANLRLSAALRPHGVTTRQYGVLRQLWRAGEGATLDELVEALHTDQSSLSRVVDRMRRCGLVATAVDPRDRRARRITLTPRGRRLEPALARHERALDARLTARFSDGDERRLRALLRRLLENVS